MGVHVDFNYAQWIAMFPEFAGVDPAAAYGYFRRAELLHRNDGGGPVTSCSVQQTLLDLVTAHIAQLSAPQVNGIPATTAPGSTPAPGIVGRVASATEGSVSISTELALADGSVQQAYYSQTKYGLEYWAATAAYRTFRYIPGFTRVFSPPFGGGGGFYG